MTKTLSKTFEDGGTPVSFEHFMEKALYDPEHGYYTKHIRSVGRSGDFSTSATITPLLGTAISRWLLENKVRSLSGFRWHIIEVGGGNGDLAHAILRSIPFWKRWGLQYHLVEISPNLRSRQQSLLSEYRVRWHQDIHSALREAKGRALIFSNELVDAFPCIVLKKKGDSFNQLHLSFSNGDARETWNDTPDLRLRDIPTSILSSPSGLSEGQRGEIHISYHNWLKSWSDLWESGHMLTIDYGDTYPELYHRRPDGTVRAYFMHQRIEGTEVYQRIGKQDLTADVNFTDLMDWGKKLGYTHRKLWSQQDFLLDYLPKKNLEEGSAEKDCLMAPEGAGTAYKVLWQTRST